MARLLLFENEELVARFRPHPLSYAHRYLGSFAWTLPGAAGAFVTYLELADHNLSWGLVTFAITGLLASLVADKIAGRRSRFGWFAALVATVLVAGDLMGLLGWNLAPWSLPFFLGVGLSLLRFIGWEMDRSSRQHFLTSERLVVRGGVGNRRERSIQLKRIEEVRSEHGFLGRALDYGALILVFGRSARAAEAPAEDLERLPGIARLQEIKHQIEQLSEETKLSPKDRRLRADERRLKSSMRLLAKWMRQGARSRP